MADNTAENKQTEENHESNPWGENFDPERAFKLLQNLKADLAAIKADRDALKAERDTLNSERQVREDAEKSDAQKLADRLAAAEKRANDAEHAVLISKVVSDYPALKGYEDLLVGADEEAVRAVADRLAKIGKPEQSTEDHDGENGGDNAGNEPTDKPEIPGKPHPDLTPGHGGDNPAPFDPVAIAKMARQ